MWVLTLWEIIINVNQIKLLYEMKDESIDEKSFCNNRRQNDNSENLKKNSYRRSHRFETIHFSNQCDHLTEKCSKFSESSLLRKSC